MHTITPPPTNPNKCTAIFGCKDIEEKGKIMPYSLYCPKCHQDLERDRKFNESLQDFVVGVSCCGLSCFEQQIYRDGFSDDWWETWHEIHRMYNLIQDLMRDESIGSTRSFAFRECMKALDLALVPRSSLS